MAPGDDPPGDSHRQRRRHGDDAVGAAEPPAGCDTGPEGEGREADEPERPRARLRLSPAANGLTRVIDPPCRRLAAADRACHPGSTRWRRYHGKAVTTSSSWPRLAELVDDPRHHPSRRRRVGVEVRAQHDEPHRHAAVAEARSVGGGQRPARRGDGELGRPLAAALDELVAVGGDRGEGVGPRLDGRRAAPPRRRRRLRAGRRGRCTPPACRAPSPRAPARRSPRTPTETRAPRRGRSARRGRPPAPAPGARRGRRRRASRSPPRRRRRRHRRPPSRTSTRSGSVHGPASSSTSSRWPLCGWVIAGYTTTRRSPSPYRRRRSPAAGSAVGGGS